jgi:hypothetical protein
MKLIMRFATILFHLTIHSVFGQVLKLDSIAFELDQEKFINRSFNSLEQDSTLLTIELRYGVRLDNIQPCLMLATVKILNEEQMEHLNARVEEIAERFYKEGSPILLSIGGNNSVGTVHELNTKGNKYNVTYLSFGNYCNVEKGEYEFEKVFNSKTMKLLGIENMEE